MIVLDPRTVIFSNFIYMLCIASFLIASIILIKHSYNGIANWIFAFILLSIDLLLLSLRDSIPLTFSIVVPHVLVIWAYIEIKRGLALFFGVKNRAYTDYFIIFTLTVLLFCNKTNVSLRIATICIASILVFIDSLILFNCKKAQTKVNPKTIRVLYLVSIILTTIRLVIGLEWASAGKNIQLDTTLAGIAILFFITNVFIFFLLFFIVLNKILSERDALITKFKSVSLRDELTGMRNRRGFYRVIEYELKHCSRSTNGFTVAMGDIDFLNKLTMNTAMTAAMKF